MALPVQLHVAEDAVQDRLPGSGDGSEVYPGIDYMIAYWMMRYYGFIAPGNPGDVYWPPDDSTADGDWSEPEGGPSPADDVEDDDDADDGDAEDDSADEAGCSW